MAQHAAAPDGLWALGSNASRILEDGYYLLFYNLTSRAWAPPRALGEALCASVENPEEYRAATRTQAFPPAFD